MRKNAALRESSKGWGEGWGEVGGALQAEKNKEPWEPPWEIGGRREERAQLPGGGQAGVGEASGWAEAGVSTKEGHQGVQDEFG